MINLGNLRKKHYGPLNLFSTKAHYEVSPWVKESFPPLEGIARQITKPFPDDRLL